ncbi:C6 finger domain protein, putative [Talaromyces stipitatus ATCC 10500]|uniref:C6 finger domain protein, putative n=1 Tax=Talaromyces stipitatus (strain ATCC 10500 / CBS 375.48 / QM 6759 / NRRL 1006) TaxID=441959 RepID=B8MQG5_TALSN|nr:C6 finger domain protein, putative [Talaromyces stipitatus ATCC 10500]EED13367.1 C6 finger domain protein, putative [Talaromyces stipitatus ATCC 10500]
MIIPAPFLLTRERSMKYRYELGLGRDGSTRRIGSLSGCHTDFFTLTSARQFQDEEQLSEIFLHIVILRTVKWQLWHPTQERKTPSIVDRGGAVGTCDETRPHCQSCRNYGVLCNFNINIPDLQLSAEAQPQKVPASSILGTRMALRTPCPTPRVTIVSAIATQTSTASFELDSKRIKLLHEFRHCMAPGWGGAMDGSLQLAHQYPFLMHAVLAVASAHERYLMSPRKMLPHRTLSELSHFSQSTTLMRRQLCKLIQPHDKDALWATAALYNVLLFLAVDAPSLEETWPLKDTSTCDLDWLWMMDAKWTLWNLTDPLRPDSIFRCLADVYADLRIHVPPNGVYDISPSLVKLCSLHEQSSAKSNPYFDAVHAISQLDGPGESRTNLTKVLAFISCMSQPFKSLILSKDARALLLLVLWYSKAGRSVWWIEMRARVERQAICVYLRRYHGDDAMIQELLPCE